MEVLDGELLVIGSNIEAILLRDISQVAKNGCCDQLKMRFKCSQASFILIGEQNTIVSNNHHPVQGLQWYILLLWEFLFTCTINLYIYVSFDVQMKAAFHFGQSIFFTTDIHLVEKTSLPDQCSPYCQSQHR